MNVLLIGHGKMGQAIEKLAIERGHSIVGIINIDNPSDLEKFDGSMVDVAIEFTLQEVAFNNVSGCIKQGIPVISGTTGWLDKYQNTVDLCNQKGGTFLYASNFSMGVNLFFKLNEWLGKLMSKYDTYKPFIEETHHIHKKDAPSGTAITLAEGILKSINYLKKWTLGQPSKEELSIKATRKDEVPGTHSVKFRSQVDEIEIRHEAFSREGFVLGAVLVAEWIKDQKGVLTMDDFIRSSSGI